MLASAQFVSHISVPEGYAVRDTMVIGPALCQVPEFDISESMPEMYQRYTE